MSFNKDAKAFVWISVILVVAVLFIFAFYFVGNDSSSGDAEKELLELLERYDAASCFKSEIINVDEMGDFIEFRVNVVVEILNKTIETPLVYKYDKNERRLVSVISGEPANDEKPASIEEWIEGLEIAEERRKDMPLCS